MARRSKGIEHWRRVIAEDEASDKTQSAFVAERRISKKTFGKWWRLLPSAPRGPGGRPIKPLKLVEVEVVREAAPVVAIFELALPGGCPLKFGAGADPDYIADLAVAFARRARFWAA